MHLTLLQNCMHYEMCINKCELNCNINKTQNLLIYVILYRLSGCECVWGHGENLHKAACHSQLSVAQAKTKSCILTREIKQQMCVYL